VFEDVVIDSGFISRIGEGSDIAFVESDIERIVVVQAKGPSLRSG
jgi:hypothetical protein